MQFKDYYRILGVSREETPANIKKAFRKLARKYHPDVSKEPDAEARMREINEAYAVLSDPEKRAVFDQVGGAYQTGQDFKPPPDWHSGFQSSSRGYSPRDATDFSDFFAELFGRGMTGQSGFTRQQPFGKMRGEDLHAEVLLDVEDAFNNTSRQISLRVPLSDGYETGRIRVDTRTLNVKIPRGVFEGQVIRLAGQGAPGAGGGPAGDLLLEVRFRPHVRYRPDRRDLHVTLPVAPWEAALGTIIPVSLPEGIVKVRIPEGAQSGSQLRVRGKGIPGSPAGDLLLDLKLVLPLADTPRARQLYETMARELAFDPRATEKSERT